MSLTPESIAETWSNGGTVQIATPADLNVFNEYLQKNYSASDMRYAEITADLDFEDGEISFIPMSPSSTNIIGEITNLTLEGNGHTIRGIVEDNLSNRSFFFWGNINNTALLNLTLYKCNMTNIFVNAPEVNRVGTIRNVKIDHCRFSVTSSGGYVGLKASSVQNYASAATIFCKNGGDYYGITGLTNSKKIALLDTVSRNTAGGTAIALHYVAGTHSLSFTRNRFTNFSTVVGVHRVYLCAVSTTYSAITAENATNIYPLGGTSNTSRPYASYYDNILIPNAAAYTDLGLTTTELQSVATMTMKGFAVEEA